MKANSVTPLPEHPSTAQHLSPTDEALRNHLWHAYGGAWQFNEIVGYLRVHIVGTQVRAEHWSVRRKRSVRTRKKTLEWVTHKLAPESELPMDGTNAEIFAAIAIHVESCRKLLAPRVLDTTLMENVGPHVNWRALADGA